jgi:hypothetical protein
MGRLPGGVVDNFRDSFVRQTITDIQSKIKLRKEGFLNIFIQFEIPILI